MDEERPTAQSGVDEKSPTFSARRPGFDGRSPTSATSGSATTCYDNGNVAGATQQYSLGQNGGAGMNCALSQSRAPTKDDSTNSPTALVGEQVKVAAP
jgi:hypothetical protein